MNTVPSMEKRFLEKFIEIMEDNFANDQFQVNDLAAEMGMSRATLHRKVKAATGKTISQVINEVRLKAAKELLINRSGTVSEVAFMVGFGSSTYFIKCFRDFYGIPPGEVLKENFQIIEFDAQKSESPKIKSKYKFVLLPVMVVVIAVILYAILFNNSENKIETPPPSTKNKAALNLYLQGLKLLDVYSGSQKEEHFMEAKIKYEQAIKLDSAFGDAYTRLAGIYLSHIPYSEKTNRGFDYSDSAMIYIEKAEHFGVGDKDFLLRMKSVYYQRRQNFQKALVIFEQRWEHREKDYQYHYERGNHGFFMREYDVTIKHLLKYLEMKPKNEMPEYDRLFKLAMVFSNAGFAEESMEFAYRQFQLINDTLKYKGWYPHVIYNCGLLEKVMLYYEESYRKQEIGTTVYNKLLEMYLLTNQNEKGLKLLPECVEYNKKVSSGILPNYIVGYYHWLKNDVELANTHFTSEIRRWEYFCELNNSPETKINYLRIAACYAMLNKKEDAINSLKKLSEIKSVPYLVVLKLQKLPMFDNLRGEPAFEEITTEIENKHREEHLRIKQSIKNSPFEINYTKNGTVSISGT